MAASARLQAAMAWKVPMWLCTPNQLGALTRQYPGSISCTSGSTVPK